ncbi:MAG: reverse transcriptase family protein, partial [Erwinia billingiae]
MAMLRALFPQAIFIPPERSIHAPVNLRTLSLISEVDALVDSGATDNFISPAIVHHFNLATRLLDKPRTIRNVDKTPNKIGAVTQAVDLVLRFKGTRTQTFYVVDLGDDHMLLGMPFLSATNPDIDWAKGIFKGKVEASTQDAHHKPLARCAEDPARLKDSLQERNYLAKYINLEPEEPLIVRRTTKATTLAAEKADKTTRTWQEQVPIEYHRYDKVFSEEKSRRLPGPRPWDHAIDLVKGAPEILDCKTYSLPEGQLKLLDEFLAEHLEKGYITANSKSPYASPFFFVTKKDGKPRPVQDYQRLNQITIRNTYPLPLIKELIRQLVNKDWFTKFDIRWGYNNVRIKEGDRWKAAFKTNRGLFEPTVMFFGLTNSPATFQTMMDAIFREEIATGDVIIYMDDILIATRGSLDYHRNRVAHVLRKLRDNDLYLKPEKCRFHQREVEYLGVIVGKGHVKMDPIKVQGIADWPTPTNHTEL